MFISIFNQVIDLSGSILIFRRFKRSAPKPIPQELLALARAKSSTYSSCETIISKARKLGRHVNSIYLPGGDDIQPELYGAKPHPKTEASKDFRRAILEFSLIDEARNNGIPLMGVCRGHQVINVFHGGQVIQHVSGQRRLQRLKLEEEAKQLFGEKLEKPFVSLVAHHQAVNTPSADSEIQSVLLYKNYTMCGVNKWSTASPVILTQFHPEALNTTSTIENKYTRVGFKFMSPLISKDNDQFFKVFGDAANALLNKKKMINQIRFRTKVAMKEEA